MNSNTEGVRKRLKEFRRKHKLTQGKMAEAAQIRQASYSDIERGKTTVISKQTLKLFELILDMNIDWLYTGEGEMRLHNNIGNLLKEEESIYGNSTISIPLAEYEEMVNISSTLNKMIRSYSKKMK